MRDGEELIKFWNSCGTTVDGDRNAEWIITFEKELVLVTERGNDNITKEDVYIHLMKMPNLDAPCSDRLHVFWLKNSLSSPGSDETSRWLYANRGSSQLDCRKLDSPCTESCKKSECSWQLQSNSLLESLLEISNWYY